MRWIAIVQRAPRARFAVVAVLSYLAIAAFAYLPAWPGDPHLLVTCACGDTVQQSWFLGWFPWAVLHGHNPFFTNWIDYPRGVNLAINTEMPLLGILGSPLSLVVSPLASYSLFLYLAYPLSATSAFFVLRRWSGSDLGAYFGALFYGFSPYMVGQGQEHLNLVFVPLPPLIFMALVELIVVQRGNPLRWGLLLGALVTLQYFVSVEVLVSTLVIAAFAVLLLAIFRARRIGAKHLPHIGRALGPALLPCALLIYPAYFALAGPRRWTGPAFPLNNVYRADFLGVVVPTASQLVAPGASLGNRFASGPVENGSYLGIPLLLIVAACIYWKRGDPWIRFAAVIAFIAYVLSLGPYLVVGSHSTTIPLPFDLLARIPVIDNLLPARFSLYTDFLVAFILSRAFATFGARSVSLRSRASARVALSFCAIAAVVSLVPNWPNREVSSVTPISRLAAKSTSIRGVVLASPFPIYPWDEAMLWQIQDDWRWKLVGGYALIPIAGRASEDPDRLAPYVAQEYLESFDAPHVSETPRDLEVQFGSAFIVDHLRTFVRKNDVDFVVFWPFRRDPALGRSTFERAFGRGSFSQGLEFWRVAPRSR